MSTKTKEWGDCPFCGVPSDETCVGWYWTAEGELLPDGFDGEPCQNARKRHEA